jgi:hypothetical protein
MPNSVLTISAPEEAEIAAQTLFEQFITPAPSGSTRSARVALACACVAATCGAACVAPLVLPAVVLAGTGAALAWLASVHTLMSALAILSVAGAWMWIWRQSKRAKVRTLRSTFYTMAAATFILALAVVWPLLEPHLARALGD